MSKLIKISSKVRQVDFHFMANSFRVRRRNDACSTRYLLTNLFSATFYTQHDEFIRAIRAVGIRRFVNWIRFRSNWNRCGSHAMGLLDEIIMCNCILSKIRPTNFCFFFSTLHGGYSHLPSTACIPAPGDDFHWMLFWFDAFHCAIPSS